MTLKIVIDTIIFSMKLIAQASRALGCSANSAGQTNLFR